MLNEPLSHDDAKKEIVRRLTVGTMFTSSHFRRAAAAESLGPMEAAKLLPAGFVQMSEFEGGNWRYRVKNGRFVIVVAFRGDDQLDLVSVFSKQR